MTSPVPDPSMQTKPQAQVDAGVQRTPTRADAADVLQSVPPMPSAPYRQRQPWTNWGQTAQCTPELTFYPASVDDLIAIVRFAGASGRKLRVAASGHSWSALVPTEDILVRIHRLNRVAMDLLG